MEASMTNPEQLHQQYQRQSLTHSAFQWLLGSVAIGLPLIVCTVTTSHRARIGSGIAAIGCVILGNSSRQEYERITELSQRLGDAIAQNTVSWVNALTAPSKTTLRQIQSGQDDPLSPLPLFDWTQLADGDEHPVLAIVAPMGGGKSRLAKWIAKHVVFPAQAIDLAAVDIYGRKRDWPTVVSESVEVLELMREDLLILQSREGSYREGQDQFEPMFRVFEEAPDTLITLGQVKNATRDIVTPWLLKYTTTTRKVKGRLCLVSVKLAGAMIGISAETRDDATIIFPGLKGISKAMNDDRMLKLGTKANQPIRDRLLASVDGLRHPALIYHQGQWYPAAIPELDPHGNPAGLTYHPELSEYLDSLTAYLTEKQELPIRSLKNAWGRNAGANAQTVDQLLAVLENYGRISQENGIIKWLGKVP
jgi:hypothetical protein